MNGEPAMPEEIPVEEELKPMHKVRRNFFGKDGKQKFRPSQKMRTAISTALGRRRMGFPPDYKGLAAELGVNKGTLQKFVYQYGKGMIELDDPPGMVQKKELDLRAENERSLSLLKRYEHLLNDTLESQIGRAEKESKDGNLLAFDQLQIPKTIGQIAVVRDLRIKLEKGVMAVLEKLMSMQTAREQSEMTPGSTTLIQNNVNVTLPAPVTNGEAQPVTVANRLQRAEIDLRSDELEIHEILRKEPGEKICVARDESFQ